MSTRSKTAISEYQSIRVNSSDLWPEWSDTDLNNEKWALPKNGTDGLFVDIEPVPMPIGLEPSDWIRAKDLKEPSFMRTLISTLISLRDCGHDGLEISSENSNFVWNGRYRAWKGWMYVYSGNKAGKGAQHEPLVNPNGKYILRLFFMGSWRRITIDDRIPVNEQGKVLLPRTTNNSELWPMLLAKGLLKLKSNSTDFHPVISFTGWIWLKLSIGHLSPRDKWDFLIKYAEHFECEPEVGDQLNHGGSTESTNNQRKGSKENLTEPRLPDEPAPTTLFLGLENPRDGDLKILNTESTCFSHFVYVAQYRDGPLDPKDAKPPLARWKLYRWLKWAISKGLIDPEEYFTPLRYLKIINPLQDYDNGVDELIKTIDEDVIQSQSMENGTQKKSSEESTKIWTDFNSLSPYVKEVHLFYKIEYFPYIINISNTFSERSASKERSQLIDEKKSKKSLASKETVNRESNIASTYFWPAQLVKSRNEPLYLLCDSTQQKFLLISFSIFRNYSREDTLAFSEATRKTHYLTVEKQSWFAREIDSKPLVVMCTDGTKSTVMKLTGGRHLLRLYCSCESPCFITVASNTSFSIGDRRKMYKLMSTESETIGEIIGSISNAAINAYRAFGTDNYQEKLKVYRKSYMPAAGIVTKKEYKVLCKQIHQQFMEQQVSIVIRIFSTDVAREILRALRVFFLDRTIAVPKIDSLLAIMKSDNKPKLTDSFASVRESNYEASGFEDESEIVNDYDRAARIIQLAFKRFILRKYKEMHNSDHQEHLAIVESLRRVINLFETPAGQESIAREIMKTIIEEDEKREKLYSYSKDFKNVLRVTEYNGSVTNVKSDQWLPIIRFIVNTEPDATVYAAINLFISLPRYSLRVFNNDSGCEMWPIVNNVAPARYRHSTNGYTIFAYGWNANDMSKQIDWTFNIVTIKGEPVFLLGKTGQFLSNDTILPKLLTEELSNTYIPNSRNLITRCVLRATKSTIVSLRFKTSYHLTKIQVRVVDEKGKVICEEEATSMIILPVVRLSIGSNDNEEVENYHSDVVYYVEAFVLDDSWPLTMSEWATALEAKTKTVRTSSKIRTPSISGNIKAPKSESARTKRSSKLFVENVSPEPPYWSLQVLFDEDYTVEIAQDTSRQLEIARLKQSWWNENSDSLERGRKLREAFLSKHTITPSVTKLQEPRKSSQLGKKTLKTSSYLVKSESRTLQPPQFYDPWLTTMDRSAFMENFVETLEVEDEVELEESYTRFLGQMSNLLKKQKGRYEKLCQNYKDVFQAGRARIDEIYEARQAYVSSIKPEKPEKNGKERSKKSKKT